MGQYFKFVNIDRKESVRHPGGLKLPEIVSSGLSGQIMTYLLFEGPFDGRTGLDKLYDSENPLAEQLVDERIQHEKQTESDHESVYRDEDGTWNRDRLAQDVVTELRTGDHAMCGRWAGDDVRIVGDYASNNYYFATDGTVTAERDTGQQIDWYGSHPAPVGGPPNETAEPGDNIETRRTDSDGLETVTFVQHQETDWLDVTDSVFSEMARYMPDRFGELDDGSLDPEIEFGLPAATE